MLYTITMRTEKKQEDFNHIVTAGQFDRDDLNKLFGRADAMRKVFERGSETAIKRKRRQLAQKHLGSRIATLFYEPSTRTKLSFEAAAHVIGAGTLSTENARDFSSAIKKETLEDTIRAVGTLADAIVLRHYEDDSAERAAAVSPVPVINAGSGSNEHPTQALTDLYTILSTKQQLHDLNVVIGGDLKHGRTARSLAQLLSLYPGNQLTFVSTDELQMNCDVLTALNDQQTDVTTTNDLHDALPQADVVYWTRLQEERTDNKELRSHFAIGTQELALMKPNAVLMHPLPRNHEIDSNVDNDPRAKYFNQVRYGLYVRAALLDKLL